MLIISFMLFLHFQVISCYCISLSAPIPVFCMMRLAVLQTRMHNFTHARIIVFSSCQSGPFIATSAATQNPNLISFMNDWFIKMKCRVTLLDLSLG